MGRKGLGIGRGGRGGGEGIGMDGKGKGGMGMGDRVRGKEGAEAVERVRKGERGFDLCICPETPELLLTPRTSVSIGTGMGDRLRHAYHLGMHVAFLFVVNTNHVRVNLVLRSR